MRHHKTILYSSFLLLLTCFVSSSSFAQALKVYWADEYAGIIYKSDPDGGNLEILITGDHLNSEEVVFGGGKIYWSDADRGIIQRADSDGANIETIVQTPEPGALGLDIGGGKIYWIDNMLGEIRRANLDGSLSEYVESLTNVGTSLTIGETDQYIYWSEYVIFMQQAVVYKRAIAGGAANQIKSSQGTSYVRGLAANETDSLIYFGLGDSLHEMDTDGNNEVALYSGGSNITGVTFDIAGGKLYWVDDGNSDVTRCDLDGSNVEVLETFARNVDGVAVDVAAAKLFWTEERFIVRAELDGTAQTHIVARPSFAAVGFHDGLDRIYYSDLNQLKTYYANSDGTGETRFWSGVGIATGGALSIQVDDVNNKIYWLDGGDRWLRKADPDSTNREDVMYLPGDAYDIALDTANNRVYWCGRSTGSIYRHNLDGSGLTETLHTGLNLPRGLTLDFPRDRIIWGEDNQIAHGAIDGGGPITVCYTDPFAVLGVVWDAADGRLYWADQLYNRVRRARFQLGAGGWLPAETIFHQGLQHWPVRIALQYTIIASGVDDVATIPLKKHFAVPNPFNPSTTVHFSLDEPCFVTVGIFDTGGRLVRKIAASTWMTGGEQQVQWNGKDASGAVVAAGVYLYRIGAGTEQMSGKVVLLK